MLDSQNSIKTPVEIALTKMLIKLAVSQGISRFIQLSTIVIYDFQKNEPIDENYVSRPEFSIQKIGIERENIFEKIGRKAGMTTIILRPASTIGSRDQKSFFARLYMAHAYNQYPVVGHGKSIVSLVDARDLGRAMVFLGTNSTIEQDHHVYLLKGFETTWMNLKLEIDRVTGKKANIIEITESLTEEQLRNIKLTPFALKTLTVNRIWNDRKIRDLGFETKYSLQDAVKTSVKDIRNRIRINEYHPLRGWLF